jgi:hypothetical protein
MIRDTYKYILYINGMDKGKTLKGCTSDIARKWDEHKVRYPNSTIQQVGYKVTRVSALKWANKYHV